jgi:hypothetical protein
MAKQAKTEVAKAKFDLMPCFEKYGSYTNTNNLPAFVRALPEIV